MKYQVDWTEDGLAALTLVWLQAADRKAVSAAQHTIDQVLANDPIAAGIPLSEGLYAIEIHPLRAQFEISDSGVVSVVSVAFLT